MTYALERARLQIHELLDAALPGATIDVNYAPPNVDADLAVPLFRVAKERGEKPPQLVAAVAEKLDLEGSFFAAATAAGGFLNFELDPERFRVEVLRDFAERGDAYGRSSAGEGKTVVIDFSSPNIAKPFSVGHLRSTVLGDTLGRILRHLGYRVIGDNHLGDWGTQFGKLLYAYEAWGEEAAIERDPTRQLLELYVRFHREAEADPSLNAAARKKFQDLEEGNEQAVALWQRFTELSLRDFNRIYRLLGVEFEEMLGESFYNDRLKDVVDQAFGKGIARWGQAERREGGGEDEDDGEVALISLEEHGIDVPLIIQKSDGTSLYATRDLATAIYRIERWQPAAILYVVGGEQKLYFRQWFKALELLGHDVECVHVWFGLVRLPQGRMSTRKGDVVFLEDVLDEAISRAAEVLQDRDLSAAEKAEIARMVGVGAVKFADLAQNRTKDVVFDWDRMLSLQGDSAPYLQYAHVRIRSILRNAGEIDLDPARIDAALLGEPTEDALLKHLARFNEVVAAAAQGYQPHVIATYLLETAQAFSGFYKQVPVLKAASEELKLARLVLCQLTARVLKEGLGLLGIECPERM